jgi:hypothetical protein
MESFKPPIEKRKEDFFGFENAYIDKDLCVHLPVVMQKVGDEQVDEYIELDIDPIIKTIKEKFETKNRIFTGEWKFKKNDKGEQEYLFFF